MTKQDNRLIGERVCRLIGEQYTTDAAFEREAGLAPKTVSNWRRGRSASFMKCLPGICKVLGVEPEEILTGEPSQKRALTREESILLEAFRAARGLSPAERASLLQTMLSVIRLCCGGVR